MYAFIGAQTDPQIPWVPHKLVTTMISQACMHENRKACIYTDLFMRLGRWVTLA